MTGKSLPLDQITKLLNEDTAQKQGFVPPQSGPLRWYDREMRCTSKGCGCSTYMKVDGIPRCSIHALKELNEVVVELTERLRS